MWSRALSQNEVAALAEQDVVPGEGLVGEYLLDEGDGDVAHDSIGGHDGRLLGASLDSRGH